jgi:Reverse transcriptase (RNA-dependent DNA polymerase)
VARQRCWKQDWILDLDIRAFFDSVPHDLLLKAVAHHTDERWVLLYIERWLKAPMQMADGTLVAREKGTPQGSPISPLLANLFMHYAFDRWMDREHPGSPFERYADDGVTRTQGGIDVEDRTRQVMLCQRWGMAPRDRPAGGGLKPPQAASVKSRGGERCGKGAPRVRQVRAEKANESKPLMTCRKRIDDIKTGRESFSRDEPGGYLPTAQAVSGIKAARAQFRLWCGTCEPVAPIPIRSFTWACAATRPARGRTPSRRNGKGQSTDAEHRDGPTRSSDEGPVMGLERRSRVIRTCLVVNHRWVG